VELVRGVRACRHTDPVGVYGKILFFQIHEKITGLKSFEALPKVCRDEKNIIHT
jgi:hypothetical protein